MDPQRWNRAREIADQLEGVVEPRRSELLEELCAGDAELRAIVEKYFLADIGSFLQSSQSGGSTVRMSDSGEAEPPSPELAFRNAEFRRRYEVRRLLGRGGMGAVHAVFDRDLRRELAMKVLSSRDSSESEVGRQRRARFVEEGQVTAQLEHPSIVPIHDLGIDTDGRIFFTMKQIQGKNLHEMIRQSRGTDLAATLPRFIDILARVGEAVAYAHNKRVIHRDLKPANIMVGDFGEAYVLDWGLARVLDSDAPEEERGDTPPNPTPATIRTDRRDIRNADPESPDLTSAKQTIGTPQFMAPEQARGERTANTIAVDIYALGAVLYEILARHAPYDEIRAETAQEVIQAVSDGPPKPISQASRNAPPELISICEKAMERDLHKRYATMPEFVSDLRAYLEDKVVRAHRTGPIVELRLWVTRNRTIAMSLVALFLITLAAAVGIAEERGRRLEAMRPLLEREQLARLEVERGRLGIVQPEATAAIDAWLASAEALLGREPSYIEARNALVERARRDGHVKSAESREKREKRTRLSTLSSRADQLAAAIQEPATDRIANLPESERAHFIEGVRRVAKDVLRRVELEMETLNHEPPGSGVEFEDLETQIQYSQLQAVISDIRVLRARPFGPIERMKELRRRCAELDVDEYDRSWKQAIAEIADAARCPSYGGLRIGTQRGLMPLGINPASGLYEFWVMASGDRPERAGAGWRMLPESGIVLILVPGGDAIMGAQSTDPAGASYFAAATSQEQPVARPRLAPYLLSRYELTQRQWERLTGQLPSRWNVGMNSGFAFCDWTNPVEQVSCESFEHELAFWGLRLPSEAEWEHAARGGRTSAFPDGENGESLRPYANFRDEMAEAPMGTGKDGFRAHAPVDRFQPNPFGFQQMSGNVWEFCSDSYNCDHREVDLQNPRGEHRLSGVFERVARGGSYLNPLRDTRWTIRRSVAPGSALPDIGVRPARDLDP